MCRNIKPLFNFDPPATDEEIRDAALQYVRKISGYSAPSAANQRAFDQAVETISGATAALISNLQTTATPKNREAEAEKRRQRSLDRFA